MVKIQVTARLDGEIVKEIEEIADCIFANKTAIVEEWLRLGREAFRKDRPDIMKLVEERRKLKDGSKKGDHRKSA